MNRSAALLIVNPHSRSAGDTDLSTAIATLEASGLAVIRVEPSSRDETEQLIERYCNRVDRVIVAGGDGTINSTVTALLKHRLALAILPLGTANDLARTLGIPEDLADACRNIIENRRRKVDVGVVNGCHFVNVANLGLGTQITRELTPEVKKHWGVFSYLKAFVTALSKNQTFRVTLIIDDREQHLRSMQLAVGNGRYYGGGNVIEEQATIDDGLLSLYSLKPQSTWDLLTLAPLLRGGKHRLAKRIFNTTGRRIEIRTKPIMPIHADGEKMTQTPAVFEVLDRALEVIVPMADSDGWAGQAEEVNLTS